MADNDAMVAAVFKALGDFAEAPGEKLRAVSRAGEMAEAFLLLINHGTEDTHCRKPPLPCGKNQFDFLVTSDWVGPVPSTRLSVTRRP